MREHPQGRRHQTVILFLRRLEGLGDLGEQLLAGTLPGVGGSGVAGLGRQRDQMIDAREASEQRLRGILRRQRHVRHLMASRLQGLRQ